MANLDGFVFEYPLLANLDRLVWEHPLVTNLERQFGLGAPLVANFGWLARSSPLVVYMDSVA